MARIEKSVFISYRRTNIWLAPAVFQEPDKQQPEAIRLKPNYAEAFSNRAIARRAKGDEAGARQDFNEAERLRKAQAV